MLFLNSNLRASTTADLLVLTAKHCLEFPGQTGTSHSLKNSRFFDIVHALPASTIIFTLSGVLDRVPVTQSEMLKSDIAHHLLDYLRKNACQLGLSNVSDIYVDDEDDRPKIAITPECCRQPFHEQIPLRVFLHQVHIQYSWQTSKSREDFSRVANPFSTQLSLPYRGLVDNVVGRFVTWHLVRRYPLIFGSWCKQLDTEVKFFPVIFRSILEMAKRSSNPSFRARFKELLKIMKRQHSRTFEASCSSLPEYLDSEPDLDDREGIVMRQETAFCLSLESLYRNGSKRPIFKCSTDSPVNQPDFHDDDELSHDQSVPISENTPSNGTDDFPWPLSSSNSFHFDRLGLDLDIGFDVPGIGGFKSGEASDINLSSSEMPTPEPRCRSTSPPFLGSQDSTTYNDLDADFPYHLVQTRIIPSVQSLTQSDDGDDVNMDYDNTSLSSQLSQYTSRSLADSQLLYSDEEDLDLNMNSDLESSHAISIPSSQTSQHTPPSLSHSQLSHSDEEDFGMNTFSEAVLLEPGRFSRVVDFADSLSNQDPGTYARNTYWGTYSCQPASNSDDLLAPHSDTEGFSHSEPCYKFTTGNRHSSPTPLEEQHHQLIPTSTPPPSSLDQDLALEVFSMERDPELDPEVDDMDIAEFDQGWCSNMTQNEGNEQGLTQEILDFDYTGLVDGQLHERTTEKGGRVKGFDDHGTLEWELDGNLFMYDI